MVDKNLFLHDLAVVAILKNEGHYLKEWLDYHLLAGVNHFYLYDNESSDNQAEVAKPYVAAGLVDYFPTSGKMMQYAVYNDAVKKFKFHCRYMAFIDGDEFIFPKTGGGIVDIVDEILSHVPNASGLAMNWQLYGSNGKKRADFRRGVLERFTRRAPVDWMIQQSTGHVRGNVHVKTLANPRTINFFAHPHYPNYLDGFYSVNENGTPVRGHDNYPVTADKIVVNHYYTKSREEHSKKMARGPADHNTADYGAGLFKEYDRNEVFDDGILKYIAERMKTFRLPDNSRTCERLLNALTVNLLPTLLPTVTQDFYRGKLETFLTCRAVADCLKPILIDEESAKFFEEVALKAVVKSLSCGANLPETLIFVREVPRLLRLPYPVVDEIGKAARELTEQLISAMRMMTRWREFAEFDYIAEFLKE